MKPEIATPNIIYKSKSPISTNKTEKALYKSLKGKKFQSPIGTNKTQGEMTEMDKYLYKFR